MKHKGQFITMKCLLMEKYSLYYKIMCTQLPKRNLQVEENLTLSTQNLTTMTNYFRKKIRTTKVVYY